MSRSSRRAEISVAVTVLVVLAVLAGAAAYVMHKHQWAGDLLAELEPRHARLQGLRSAGPTLEQAVAAAQGALSKLAYPATQEANQAGNDAQQRVRRALETAGLTVVSSQVLPPVPGEGHDRIPLSLRLEGSLPALQAALAALANETPVVVVDALTIQTIGPVRPDQVQRLACQLSLSVLRVQG